MKKELCNVLKQTSNGHINLFVAVYKLDDRRYYYEFASRKDGKDLGIYNKKIKPDAVRILPYFIKDNKAYVVAIKEFRYALNRCIYSLPAGLIDNGENAELTAKRELIEETGFIPKNLTLTEKPTFISEGFSDEAIVCYEAEVEKRQKQNLIGNEQIQVKIFEINELMAELENKNFSIQSKLLIKNFYYKQKIKELEKQVKKQGEKNEKRI